MARETGIYRRPDSRFWWIATTLPNGKRLRQSAGTENREEAEALLAKLTLDAYRERHFGLKPERSWQEAVVRYLAVKSMLRSFGDVQRICRMLDPYLGTLTLNQINGDAIWSVVQGELKKGNKPATVNRYLALIRSLLRMARDEWQWIDSIPKIRLLPGEVERDRWLTREEAERLIAGLSATSCGTGAVCPGDRVSGAGDYRARMGAGGFGEAYCLAESNQEWHAARRPVES